MKKLCKTCFFWHQNERNYYTPEGEVYGSCVCGKFICPSDFCPPYTTDQLIYWDYREYGASFATGPEFGCIHWRKKEEEAEK